MRSILPLILLEGYLILTLVLLFFGPVTFDLHNVDLFLMYMFIYHIAFILGYYLSIKSFIINKKTINYEYSSFKFYVLLIFGAFSILLTYKNIMMSDSLIPFDIFNEFKNGLSNPGAIYSERMERIASGEGGSARLLNLLSIFFSFTKLLFLFYSIFYWKKNSFFKKI